MGISKSAAIGHLPETRSTVLCDKGNMKKYLSFLTCLFFFFVVIMYGCEKRPDVICLNNFTMIQKSERARIGISDMEVAAIAGQWMGMGHKIQVERSISSINEVTLYGVMLIDTASQKDGGPGYYNIHFMKVAEAPYIEAIYLGDDDPHGFGMTTSTFLKIERLGKDTVVFRMLDAKFLESWLKKNGYRSFVPTEEKNSEVHTIYLIDDPPRLAQILRQLNRVPKAFQSPDTIIRVEGEQPEVKHFIQWGTMP